LQSALTSVNLSAAQGAAQFGRASAFPFHLPGDILAVENCEIHQYRGNRQYDGLDRKAPKPFKTRQR
jgi:hypothetical protein